MKRTMIWSLLIVFGLLVAACAPSAAPAEEAAPTEAPAEEAVETVEGGEEAPAEEPVAEVEAPAEEAPAEEPVAEVSVRPRSRRNGAFRRLRRQSRAARREEARRERRGRVARLRSRPQHRYRTALRCRACPKNSP